MQALIKRAEIRIFEQQQSLEAAPLKIITVDDAGLAEWHPTQEILAGPYATSSTATRLRLEWQFRRNGCAAAAGVREQLLGSVVTSDGPSNREAAGRLRQNDLARQQFRSAAAR